VITSAVAWWRRHWATVVLAGAALAVGMWLGLTAPDTSPVSRLPSTAPVQGP
jgi:hypothetical protein